MCIELGDTLPERPLLTVSLRVISVSSVSGILTLGTRTQFSRSNCMCCLLLRVKLHFGVQPVRGIQFGKPPLCNIPSYWTNAFLTTNYCLDQPCLWVDGKVLPLRIVLVEVTIPFAVRNPSDVRNPRFLTRW